MNETPDKHYTKYPTSRLLFQKGYIALSIVLIISFVVIAISATVALLAIGEAQSGFALTQGDSTLSFVDGCMEDALLKARASSSYAGGTITRPEGTCSITVVSGATWTITATTTSTSYARTEQATVTRDGYGLTILSWKEQ